MVAAVLDLRGPFVSNPHHPMQRWLLRSYGELEADAMTRAYGLRSWKVCSAYLSCSPC
jgi:hypothetical protein